MGLEPYRLEGLGKRACLVDELSRAIGGLGFVVVWALEGTCTLCELDRRKRREATL